MLFHKVRLIFSRNFRNRCKTGLIKNRRIQKYAGGEKKSSSDLRDVNLVTELHIHVWQMTLLAYQKCEGQPGHSGALVCLASPGRIGFRSNLYTQVRKGQWECQSHRFSVAVLGLQCYTVHSTCEGKEVLLSATVLLQLQKHCRSLRWGQTEPPAVSHSCVKHPVVLMRKHGESSGVLGISKWGSCDNGFHLILQPMIIRHVSSTALRWHIRQEGILD